MGEFWRGGDSLRVPLAMHEKNRNRFKTVFKLPSANHVLVVFGGEEISVYNSDTVWDNFRQESYFQWLVGAKEPGLVLVMTANGEFTLLVPEFPDAYETWMGPRKLPKWYAEQYGISEVGFVGSLSEILSGKIVVIIQNENFDSGQRLEIDSRIGNFDREISVQVGEILDELRAVKTREEVEILQFVNDVSSKAHIEVMMEVGGNFRSEKPKFECSSREYYAEAVFRFGCAARGCARVGYSCIACSGERNAILHYGHAAEPNNEEIPKESHLRLLDMGAEYHGYTADITNTFPTSGKFSDLQKSVYTCVWETVLFVERLINPGVNYDDVHIIAQRHLLEQIVSRTALIRSEFHNQLDYLSNTLNIVPRLFMPHGLGHMLGLNVHDVGGYQVHQSKSDEISVRGLRLARPLMSGFVITVEPGIYFIEYLKQQALADPALAQVVDWAVWDACRREVGGVRIEDDVLITDAGCRVLTDLPRTVEEIEGVMAGTLTWTVGNQYRKYSTL